MHKEIYENKNPLDQQKVLSYMHTHRTMTLATVGGEGEPWAAAVFYVNRGFKLYFLSEEETRHSRNIAFNPQVSVTINEDYRHWPEIKGIQMVGKAGYLEKGLEKGQALTAYLRKFPFVASFFTDPEFRPLMLRVKLYYVYPETVWFLDNSQGFSNRRKISV